MNLSVFESDRKFSLVSYTWSHGQLLLRSPRPDDSSLPRIDVLFKDVRALDLRASFSGMKIVLADETLLANFPSKAAEMIEPGLQIFELTSNGWTGFVLAGAYFVHEDFGSPFDPSALLNE